MSLRCATAALIPVLVSTVACGSSRTDLNGTWRAALDLAGGPLRFHVNLAQVSQGWVGHVCNGDKCDPFSEVTPIRGDSLLLGMADYAAAIRVGLVGDSLVGFYRNVGNRGPRTIPFRAARGRWPVESPPASLVGQWDATFTPDENPSPRVLQFRDTERGLEGTIISNTGDSGLFWGRAEPDSFSMSHFDGSFVYMLTGRISDDTLFGIFHAGLTSQRPFYAVRSTGNQHLTPPNELVQPDTTGPFVFAFPDLAGNIVTNDDPRFEGKVVIVEILGTWCPTCHDAAPTLVRLHETYANDGLEIVGLAYEVTGDPEVDGALVTRYAEKFGIEFPILLAGINDSDSPRATQPQLDGPIAFPTTIFLDRSGRVRRVHSGFYGPAIPDAYEALERDLVAFTEQLLNEDEERREH